MEKNKSWQLTGSIKAMISSSLRIKEFDFLGMFGGRVRGRGGREVNTGSKFMLLARLSREPLLLFSVELLLSFLLDGLSVVLVVEMVRGVVASLLLPLLAVVSSKLVEETKLGLEETSSSTVVGTAYVERANSATVRGTLGNILRRGNSQKNINVIMMTLIINVNWLLFLCNSAYMWDKIQIGMTDTIDKYKRDTTKTNQINMKNNKPPQVTHVFQVGILWWPHCNRI